jgi:large subunit ribosomal protein L29
MKAEEIRGLTEDKIRAEIDGAREELMKMRFQQSTGELLDPSRIREIRRSIARMQTILN